MDPDKQMVRGQDGDYTNLAIGEPLFLQRQLAHVLPVAPAEPHMPEYPPYQGTPELLAALKAWFPDYHAVVTNGAKQAILAALYALEHALEPGGVDCLPPYWPSYPTLAKLSSRNFNLTLRNTLGRDDTVRIIAAPNNPDGRQVWNSHSLETCDIWDAAYAHWVYGWNGIQPHHRISVWSAAKAFGFSGERVGWALTKDPELCTRMADYVEKTTSGVNVRAQNRVAGIYTDVRDEDLNEAYIMAQRDLQENVEAYEGLIAPHVVGSRTTVGMFAWFKTGWPESFPEILERAKVRLVDGAACGMPAGAGWYRMSLGQPPEVHHAALLRLSKELKEFKYG